MTKIKNLTVYQPNKNWYLPAPRTWFRRKNPVRMGYLVWIKEELGKILLAFPRQKGCLGTIIDERFTIWQNIVDFADIAIHTPTNKQAHILRCVGEFLTETLDRLNFDEWWALSDKERAIIHVSSRQDHGLPRRHYCAWDHVPIGD